MDLGPEVLIDADEIANRVKELGAKISEDYKGQEVTVICVLKGGFIFCSDLVRQMKVPTKVEYIMLSSYGNSKTSSGEPKIELDVTGSVEGKNVLIVEDIIDTGNTVHFLENLLKHRKARSVKLAALLFKPGKSRHNINIDYLGFEIEDKFVIGYGLDYAGRYRELSYVGILNAGH